MPNPSLIFVAASGFGCKAAWAARDARQPWDVIEVLDDSTELAGKSVAGAPALGPVSRRTKSSDAHFHIAIGSTRIRRKVLAVMEQAGPRRFATIIHRSVQSSPDLSTGAGSVICANVVMTTNIAVGTYRIINLGRTGGHDVLIGDFCTLARLVAIWENVSLGNGAEIGTGACMRQGLALDSGCLVGMGSVLAEDVPENALWIGNPAAYRRDIALRSEG